MGLSASCFPFGRKNALKIKCLRLCAPEAEPKGRIFVKTHVQWTLHVKSVGLEGFWVQSLLVCGCFPHILEYLYRFCQLSISNPQIKHPLNFEMFKSQIDIYEMWSCSVTCPGETRKSPCWSTNHLRKLPLQCSLTSQWVQIEALTGKWVRDHSEEQGWGVTHKSRGERSLRRAGVKGHSREQGWGLLIGKLHH